MFEWAKEIPSGILVEVGGGGGRAGKEGVGGTVIERYRQRGLRKREKEMGQTGRQPDIKSKRDKERERER